MNIIDLDLILDRKTDLGDRGFQSDGRTTSLMSRPTELKGFEPKSEGEYMYKEAYGFLANDNPVMGRHFLGKAYELGNFAAGNDLAYGLCHGWFGERDYDTATKIYRKLARKGDPDAMNNYAFCYLLGTGVKKNLRLAEFWMWKAIWKGNIHAAASYAQLVLENTFSKISKNLGMWLCFWAADNGESGAMNDLGLSYETGFMVKKDLKKAYEWFMKSVEHGGGACAEFNVSRCSRYGLGVEEDERQADAWQHLAIEHGFDIEAYNNLYDLG